MKSNVVRLNCYYYSLNIVIMKLMYLWVIYFLMFIMAVFLLIVWFIGFENKCSYIGGQMYDWFCIVKK